MSSLAYNFAKSLALSQIRRYANKKVDSYFRSWKHPTPNTKLKSLRVTPQPSLPTYRPTFKSGTMVRQRNYRRSASKFRRRYGKRKQVSRRTPYSSRSFYRRRRGYTSKPGGQSVAHEIAPRRSYTPSSLEKKVMSFMSPVYERRQIVTFDLQDSPAPTQTEAVYLPMLPSLELYPKLYGGTIKGTVTDAAFGDDSTTGWPGEFAPATNKYLERYYWKHRTVKINMVNASAIAGKVDIFLAVRRRLDTLPSAGSGYHHHWADWQPRPNSLGTTTMDSIQPVNWKEFKILKRTTLQLGAGWDQTNGTVRPTVKTYQIDIPVDRVIMPSQYCTTTTAQSATDWDDLSSRPVPFIAIVPRLDESVNGKVNLSGDNVTVEMYVTDVWTYMVRNDV